MITCLLKSVPPELQPIQPQGTGKDDLPEGWIVLLLAGEYHLFDATRTVNLVIGLSWEVAEGKVLEAQQRGSTILIRCTKEHAEHYVGQLLEKGLRSRMEKG